MVETISTRVGAFSIEAAYNQALTETGGQERRLKATIHGRLKLLSLGEVTLPPDKFM